MYLCHIYGIYLGRMGGSSQVARLVRATSLDRFVILRWKSVFQPFLAHFNEF